MEFGFMKFVMIVVTTIAFACLAQADEPSPGPAPATSPGSCQTYTAECASVDCLLIDDEIAYDED